MAAGDNILLNAASNVGGATLGTELINGAHIERVKLITGEHGVDGGNVSADNPLPTTSKFQSNQTGTWGYNAGVAGTLTLTGGKKVIGIAAHATVAGSMSINGGDSIPIPANSGIQFSPVGTLVNPTIIFTGTDSYVAEYIS